MKVKDYREKYRRINIPISEYDIETFESLIYKRRDHIDWTFETDDGEPINLKFVRDYEEEEWIVIYVKNYSKKMNIHGMMKKQKSILAISV